MKVDYSILRVRILGWYGTYKKFATVLGISCSTLRRYLQCERPIPIMVIYRMVELLEIPDLEVVRYFFMRAST